MKNKGFTLVEVLVTISIIVIMTGIVFISYRTGQQQLTLQRTASKLSQDIRRVAAMATEAQVCISPPGPSSCPSSPGGVPAGGYGLYVSRRVEFRDRYFIYADDDTLPKPHCYNVPGDPVETMETIYLEKGVYIKNLSSSYENLSINFLPPDPMIELKNQSGGICGDISENIAAITIALESDDSKTKTITVNKAGLVEID